MLLLLGETVINILGGG